MTTATESHTEHTIEVAGLALRYLKGGAGTPLVLLHHSTGNLGWIPLHESSRRRSASPCRRCRATDGRRARVGARPRDIASVLVNRR